MSKAALEIAFTGHFRVPPAHREAECQEIRNQHHAHWGGKIGNGIRSKVSEGWNLQMKFWYWRAHCSLSLNSFLELLQHAEWVLFVSNVPSFVKFLQWNQECYEKSWWKFIGCQAFSWKRINLYKFSFTSITILKSWRFTFQKWIWKSSIPVYIEHTHFKNWFD